MEKGMPRGIPFLNFNILLFKIQFALNTDCLEAGKSHEQSW